MAIRRRSLLAVSSMALVTSPKHLLAQPVDITVSNRGPDYRSDQLSGVGLEGTDPALADERQTAGEILSNAKRTCQTPLQFFTAFEALSRPDIRGIIRRNRDGELYNEGWHTRWNPVIVSFFQETRTQPSGDETFWCAASLNWCLARSGLRTTRSASSGSFRNAEQAVDSAILKMIAGALTTTPKPGDIVVFRSTDHTMAQAGRGHVALFLRETPDRVQVVGGNQLTSDGHYGFSKDWYPKKGVKLVLDSYRSIESFAS